MDNPNNGHEGNGNGNGEEKKAFNDGRPYIIIYKDENNMLGVSGNTNDLVECLGMIEASKTIVFNKFTSPKKSILKPPSGSMLDFARNLRRK